MGILNQKPHHAEPGAPVYDGNSRLNSILVPYQDLEIPFHSCGDLPQSGTLYLVYVLPAYAVYPAAGGFCIHVNRENGGLPSAQDEGISVRTHIIPFPAGYDQRPAPAGFYISR